MISLMFVDLFWRLAQANMIIKQIEFYQKKQKENPKEVQRKFHIVCMPEKNINFERFFEHAGVWKGSEQITHLIWL